MLRGFLDSMQTAFSFPKDNIVLIYQPKLTAIEVRLRWLHNGFVRGGPLLRKLILASLALLALTFPAMASDLGAPPYAPSNWTGYYVGGNAGGLWGHQHWINQTQGGDFFGYSLGEHDQGS